MLRLPLRQARHLRYEATALFSTAPRMSDALRAALPDSTMEIINATAPVVAGNINTITQTFYPKMFANNPEVLAFFNLANQRSSRQSSALANSIVASVGHINNLKDIESALSLIAHKHCALGVFPEHYQIVHDNFMGAVAEVLGDAVTPEIGQAWSDVVMHVAKACIQMEAEIYKKSHHCPAARLGRQKHQGFRRGEDCR